MITATFQQTAGFVRVVGTSLPQDYFLFRASPAVITTFSVPASEEGHRLPAFDYTLWNADQIAADYLVPLGEAVTYGAKKIGDPFTNAIDLVTVYTPSGVAYLRHMFFPGLGVKVRVNKFDDRRPSRLTTYAISGMRNAMATYDVRNGREGPLSVVVNGKAERDALEDLLADGAPISLNVCAALGNDPGVFAVGDVDFMRHRSRDLWLVTLDLTEVDPPQIIGTLARSDIPGVTYDERAAQINFGTYDDAAAKWAHYFEAMV